jgi:hypothetical protein
VREAPGLILRLLKLAQKGAYIFCLVVSSVLIGLILDKIIFDFSRKLQLLRAIIIEKEVL